MLDGRTQRRRGCKTTGGAMLVALAACAVAAAGEPTPEAFGFNPGDLPTASVDAEPLVKPELVTDVAAIQPGKPFRLGVLFRLKPTWHVYWKNPGDAGMATAVDFDLPAGLRAGPLHWPAPMAFRQAGDIVGYGYEKHVLLWAPVTVSKDLRPGGEVELRVEAAWLACKDMCVAGDRKLRLRLPLAAKARPARRDLFERWHSRLPVRGQTKGSGVRGLRIAGQIPPGETTGRFTITADWSQPPAAVEFYPAAGRDVEVRGATVRTKGARTTVTFTAASLAGAKQTTDTLEGVLVHTQANGTRRAVRLDVPLRKPTAAPSAKSPEQANRDTPPPTEGGAGKGERHD